MPPKKPAPKKATGTNKPTAKSTSTKAPSKPGAGPASKKASDTKKAAAQKKEVEKKPAEKVWTKEDDAARTIQTCIRGFLARRKLNKLKKQKEEYEELMEKLERDAYIKIAQQRQKEAEEEARKEMEERKRKAEERKRVKRMLEAAFDGDIDEMNVIIKEVRENDNKMNIGHDVVGEALRMRHLMNIVDCEDAHGHTPLSETSSGGNADAINFLIGLGADPNSRGQFERTPLYRAAFAGHLDCCEALLQHGSDPRLYANDGQTPADVASQEGIRDLLQNWDNSQTDQLLEKIVKEKNIMKEKERARREAEQSEIERQLAEVQKEYDAHQKTLSSLYAELNKRIVEHDTAPAMGFDKPEITLQAIHDAEEKLELAKVDFEIVKEKIRVLKTKQRDQMKEAAEAGGEELPGLKITIQELPDTLLRDVGNKIKNSGKWPMIIDTSNRTPTFLRYQDTNYINALMPKHMEHNLLRLAIIGAIRYGKPVVLDMMEVDMFEAVAQRMDNIIPGLLNMIMDKSILQEENYLKLVKKEDGPEYFKENFNPMRIERFQFHNYH